MNTLKVYIHRRCISYLTFLKWLLLATIVGIIVGSIGTLFHFAIGYATKLRLNNPYTIYFLPINGIIIVFLYHISKQGERLNTNLVLESIRSNEKLPLRMAPLIFIATVLTHLSGGSSGREGAALQLGGSLSSFIGRLFHLNDDDLRLMTMCGMSAAFAALFRTPIGATIFAMEVISVGIMYYVALVPCILSALIGYGISGYFGIAATHYILTLPSNFDLLLTAKVLLLGILCAILSICFCKTLHQTNHLYKRLIHNDYIRILVGSALLLLLIHIFKTRDYLGAGTNIIDNAIHGEAIPYAFILKIIFTALTLGAGFKGGEIVPSFFVGATFGAFIGPIIGLPASFAASLSLIAVFCGVTNCPITSFILAVEIFSGQSCIYFMLIIATSYMLSGYTGLYSKQKIMYSKTKPTFVNTNAH